MAMDTHHLSSQIASFNFTIYKSVKLNVVSVKIRKPKKWSLLIESEENEVNTIDK